MGILANYETAEQTAERLNVSRGRVLTLCREGRFEGAEKLGAHQRAEWRIPKGSVPSSASMGPQATWES